MSDRRDDGGSPPKPPDPAGHDGDDRDELIEALASAFRERDAFGAVRSHSAFHDLDEDGRREAFELARKLRRLEAAIDPEGLSTTARAVLARIQAASKK
jgi:hypothetical protein